MKIQILNAQQVIFDGVVSEAILPGADGELSILDDHEPIFVALGKGFIRLTPISRKWTLRQGQTSKGTGFEEFKPILIERGVARMKGNELNILVE